MPIDFQPPFDRPPRDSRQHFLIDLPRADPRRSQRLADRIGNGGGVGHALRASHISTSISTQASSIQPAQAGTSPLDRPDTANSAVNPIRLACGMVDSFFIRGVACRLG